MLGRLNELSPRGRAMMMAAIVVLTPIAGWLGYRLGFVLGSN